MLPYLSTDISFPPVEQALDDPNGLLAAGADLSSERLIQAYSQGIFPWYSPGEPILWWSPDPRTVFFVNHFKIHKSVKKTLRKSQLTVTLNFNFKETVKRCSRPRSAENGTWITKEMIEAYCELHRLGKAHSLEVWQGNQLVGGIYGVVTGGVFCGESMFSEISNGSKIALSCLARYLKQLDFKLIDCQIENPHLMKLGASNISRKLYLSLLHSSSQQTWDSQQWQPQRLHWPSLLDITGKDDLPLEVEPVIVEPATPPLALQPANGRVESCEVNIKPADTQLSDNLHRPGRHGIEV
ncbi:leucyl/phenylalanyl-tRNA--protein transferase [Aliikangiella coralliicola]|uniref:Leucyl/phenylalanyl-tRNA--protein transferase n=2 Tax=Aliikangiella coralliicola TaxID=2592383 RepID=A0A545UDX0_9GAMM|nr:leucyl/phenylalanyl-tRNA--protein transferase [Aliikangiella coralliicola]